MFTGIVTDVGRLRAVRETNRDLRFEVETKFDLSTIDMGASISHAGCCLTIVEKGDDWFAVEISGETISLTTLGAWKEGDPINLERAARVGDACDLEGPCGRPATPPHRGANLALIGQGPRIAPLLALIDGGWGGMQMVTAVATAGQAYPAALLPARVAHTWFAGQQGEQAFWGAVAEVARWAEAVYLSGTERFYARARDTIARERIVTPPGAVQAWMWRDMACGSGACGACLVPTRHGARRACTDGPWLDVADLILAAMPEA